MYSNIRILYHFCTIFEEFWGFFVYAWNYKKNPDKLAKKIIQKIVKTQNFHEKLWEMYYKLSKFIVLTHIVYSTTILSQCFGWTN